MDQFDAARSGPGGIPSPKRLGSRGAGRALALWALASLLATGCEIAPVVSAPNLPSTRYRDCERAAAAYCEQVIEARERELDRCIADLGYKCVAGKVE